MKKFIIILCVIIIIVGCSKSEHPREPFIQIGTPHDVRLRLMYEINRGPGGRHYNEIWPGENCLNTGPLRSFSTS